MPAERIDNYYSASCNRDERYPTLEESVATDVLIIGGGMTGVATAVELAERGSEVVLLEANRIGWGATGRNGGQVTGSLSGDAAMLRQLTRRHGREHAEDTLRWLRWHGHEIIERRVARYGIDCDLTHGHLFTAWNAAHVPELEATLDEARAAGLADEVTWLDRDQVHEQLATPLYAGAILNRRNFHLHSLNLCLGEAAAAASLGVRIHEQTEVMSIESTASRLEPPGHRAPTRPALRTLSVSSSRQAPTSAAHGNEIERTASAPVIARTSHGEVRAERLVLAGNAYHRLLPRQLSGFVFPAVLGNLVTEPLGEDRARQLIRDNVAVYDSRMVLDYYRLTADHRLMFGGGTNYTGREIPDVATNLRPALERVFPSLAGIAVDYAWTGKAAIVPNRIPIIGQLPGNILFAQGYSGHGMASSHILAEVLADHLHGESQRFETLSRLRHLRLPIGETLGGAAMALAMAFHRLREK
ncbi:MAG: FAD-dependent oxidoreductase [Gammaproteobacteria bacterium]|nr:MAG: FAD-dependent oxidoreductase [Gammaproteobacteria bacterium]